MVTRPRFRMSLGFLIALCIAAAATPPTARAQSPFPLDGVFFTTYADSFQGGGEVFYALRTDNGTIVELDVARDTLARAGGTARLARRAPAAGANAHHGHAGAGRHSRPADPRHAARGDS